MGVVLGTLTSVGPGDSAEGSVESLGQDVTGDVPLSREEALTSGDVTMVGSGICVQDTTGSRSFTVDTESIEEVVRNVVEVLDTSIPGCETSHLSRPTVYTLG